MAVQRHQELRSWEARQMANPAPKTKDFKAWQNVIPGGRPKLIVIGKVQTSNTNQTPHLEEHTPQGINPKILLLDLTITTKDVGDALQDWRDVRFEKSITRDQYSNVDILWDGNIIEHLKVETAE
jgi:hypothetical protein